MVELATLEWVDWFNHRRLLNPIGYVPPVKCEEQYYRILKLELKRHRGHTFADMGSYTELTVAGYPLVTSKSEVVPEVMTIFRETDRRVFTRRVSDRNPLVWGAPDPDNQEIETAIEYSCPAHQAIDRLDVMGFSIRRVRGEL